MNALLLWQQYARDPQACQQIALSTPSQQFSWQELAQQIDQRVEVFRQLGVKKGHCVALVGRNSLELVLAYLAVLQLGGRVLGINPAFNPQKIRQICRNNQVYLCWSAEKSLCFADIEPNPDYCRLTMTLTSGSSGKAKAVVHELAAHLANAQGVCELMGFTRAHSWLLSLPLFHVSGQGILWRWLLQGARLRLAEQDFYAQVAQASHISFVPTQLQRWLAYLKQNPDRLNQRQHILLGGSAIPASLVEQAEELGLRCYCGYGLTEMASTVFAKRYNKHKGVGQALAGREYRLVDNEIWLKGAGLALGYWQQGGITPLLNAQGWFATKDKGRLWHKELIVEGRLDNMFISGGENIQPEEIESLLLQYPLLEQVMVLPVADPQFGFRPVAMVRLASGFSPEEVARLRAWLADKLEKFKQPIAYFSLPAQSQGIKLSRYELQQQLNALWQAEGGQQIG